MVDSVYMYVQTVIFQIQTRKDVKHHVLMDYLLKLLIIHVLKPVHMINLGIKLIINVYILVLLLTLFMQILMIDYV